MVAPMVIAMVVPMVVAMVVPMVLPNNVTHLLNINNITIHYRKVFIGAAEARPAMVVLRVSRLKLDGNRARCHACDEAGGAAPQFPIVADDGLELSKAFDMLPAEAYLPDGRTPNDSATVRAVFIIGPDKQLKLSLTYPMTVGRNFGEVLRALDALQLSTGKGVATPADWQVGQDVVIPPALSDEDAKAKFGEFETVLPYLRLTKAPQ